VVDPASVWVGSPFVDPRELSLPQLGLFLWIYGQALYYAAGVLKEGTDLLLLIPGFSKLTASMVMPIIGAVPSAMMVVACSTSPTADSQMGVAMGVLSGSIVVLLTVTWALSILIGRVELDRPRLDSSAFRSNGSVPTKSSLVKIRQPKFSFSKTGVQILPMVSKNAVLMLGTAALFLVGQVPAALAKSRWPECHIEALDSSDCNAQRKYVHGYMLVGAVMCGLIFLVYHLVQYRAIAGTSNLHMLEMQVHLIQEGVVTLRGALQSVFLLRFPEIKSINDVTSDQAKDYAELVVKDQEVRKQLQDVLCPFFMYYDANHSNGIDTTEFYQVVKDLGGEGSQLSEKQLDALFRQCDKDESENIDFQEFTDMTLASLKMMVLKDPVQEQSSVWNQDQQQARTFRKMFSGKNGELELEEIDDEDVPEDLVDLSASDKQLRLKMRAARKLAFGALMVVIFTEPIVDVLQEIGMQLGVAPFYVSFIAAPFACNAPDFVAAYAYSIKKNSRSSSVAFMALVGSVCMCNTMGLGIFYWSLYSKTQPYTFQAESLAVLFVQVVVGFLACNERQTMGHAVVVTLLYPTCLAIVWVLENKVGID